MAEPMTPEALEAIAAKWARVPAGDEYLCIGRLELDRGGFRDLLAEVERLRARIGEHECGALDAGPDGGRLVACTARVPGPRFYHIHAKGADNA